MGNVFHFQRFRILRFSSAAKITYFSKKPMKLYSHENKQVHCMIMTTYTGINVVWTSGITCVQLTSHHTGGS